MVGKEKDQQVRLQKSQRVYARWVFFLGLLLAAIWAAARITPVVQAVLIAAFLAYFLYPAISVVERRTGLRRAVAVQLSLISLILVLAALVTVVWIFTARNWDRLLQLELQSAWQSLYSQLPAALQVFGAQLSVGFFWENIAQITTVLVDWITNDMVALISNLTISFFQIFVVFVCLYYLLIDGGKIAPWALKLVPLESRPEIERLLKELDIIWRVFLRVQVLITIILGILLVLGVLAMIALHRSGLISLSPLGVIVLLILLFTAVQQVDNLWLRPKWMGQNLQLHPGLVFAGLTAGLAVGGVFFALLAVPLIATVRVVGGYVYRKLNDLPAWDVEQFIDEINVVESPLSANPDMESPG